MGSVIERPMSCCDRELEDQAPNQNAQALVFPNTHRRTRRDRTRSLNILARNLQQQPAVPADAVPPPTPQPMQLPRMQPPTSAGLPVRCVRMQCFTSDSMGWAANHCSCSLTFSVRVGHQGKSAHASKNQGLECSS